MLPQYYTKTGWLKTNEVSVRSGNVVVFDPDTDMVLSGYSSKLISFICPMCSSVFFKYKYQRISFCSSRCRVASLKKRCVVCGGLRPKKYRKRKTCSNVCRKVLKQNIIRERTDNKKGHRA